jgi:hypothetical protein
VRRDAEHTQPLSDEASGELGPRERAQVVVYATRAERRLRLPDGSGNKHGEPRRQYQSSPAFYGAAAPPSSKVSALLASIVPGYRDRTNCSALRQRFR